MKYYHSKIEKKWQKIWLKEGIYEPNLKNSKNPLNSARGKPFYNLMMFPYPSAEGLHVGNMYAFTGSDIYGRFKRMQGCDVFEPIGLDGFGIHSENYAIKIGQHPADQAKISEKNFYRQLQMIGNGFAWNEKLETYDPEYYQWTQWIFVRMFKKGFAYRNKASVNWCPSCLTVLADEQVISGQCERCGTKVIKKELEQWFFRITQYADRLLEGLEKIDWSEKVKIAQRNWIGKSEGASIKFPVSNSQFSIEVFTTRPDTLFGATYMVLAPEHPLIRNFKFSIFNFQEVEKYIEKTKLKSEADRIAADREKTGVELKGLKAINPANQKEISVWVADYVLGGVGTGAIMAVPAHDARDYEFAVKFNLPIIEVIKVPKPGLGKAYEGRRGLVNSGKFDGMDSEKAKWEITKFVGGERKTQYRLRDWLISRQRYWGPPIPMIHCDKCDWQPVSEQDLPVKLPYIKNFRPTGTEKSPLASDENFYKTKCPKCGGEARRETDVSDTFLDSAWYYLGYLNLENPFDKAAVSKWLPVNMYIGGAEHSVLHLLYVRFLAMVFHDLGLVSFEEPFPKFWAHGLITKDGAKMSKSKGNVINPDEYINKHGADALRMYLMFLGPFDQGGDFRDGGIKGLTRFLERVSKLIPNSKFLISKKIPNNKVQKILHQTIKKVTEDIEGLRYNTAISALMILLNGFESNLDSVSKKDKEIFLQLLAPFAPHLTEEIWQRIRGSTRTNTQINAENISVNQRLDQRKSAFKSIHISPWPKFDPGLIKENEVDLIIQVNGKMRGVLRIPVGVGQKEVEDMAKLNKVVSKYLAKPAIKIIFVKDKLINFVV